MSELDKDEFLSEYEVLSGRHGHAGAWVRLLKKHTTARQWVRFTLFVTAYVLIVYGLTQRPIPTGLTYEYLSVGSAAVWGLFAIAAMVTTYKGLGWLIRQVRAS